MPLFFVEIVQSAQHCSLFSNDTALTTTNGNTRLMFVLPNTHIRCACYNNDGNKIFKNKKWFLQNGQLIADKKTTAPYSIHKAYQSFLVIPVANSSYNGIYTCGGAGRDPKIYTTTVKVITATKPGKL